jgi:uncharacterized repeat protein (TIGR04138 family)
VQKRLDTAAERTIHHGSGSRCGITGPFASIMTKVPFEQSVSKATARDPRYAADAYAFLRDSLDHTIRAIQKGRGREPGHVSGPELCKGLRDYAVQQYGPMVPTILEAWGIRSTRDIGEMVFNLIEAGAFSKSDTDTPADFDNVYDFDDAFVKPFLPSRGMKPGTSQDRKKGQ